MCDENNRFLWRRFYFNFSIFCDFGGSQLKFDILLVWHTTFIRTTNELTLLRWITSSMLIICIQSNVMTSTPFNIHSQYSTQVLLVPTIKIVKSVASFLFVVGGVAIPGIAVYHFNYICYSANHIILLRIATNATMNLEWNKE